MSSAYLQKCTGFCDISTIIDKILEHSEPTIEIQDTGNYPLLSRGKVATLPKRPCNTSKIPPPANFGDVIHYDIIYGDGRAIGGVYYGILCVDRKTRCTFIYPLKNLKKLTIQNALKQLVLHLGRWPSEMIADRDFRLIGEHVTNFFAPNTLITGAPKGRQSQNGKCEINWRYLCDLARNWLAEHFMPPEHWFFPIRYAVQVRNYLPIQSSDGSTTTPYFLAHDHLPDYRKLISLFSAAYVNTKISDTTTNTFRTQTVPAILVGNDDKSDGRFFCNPSTKHLIGTSDYRLDIQRVSGPAFNLSHHSDPNYTLYHPSNPEDRPPAYNHQSCVKFTKNHPLHPSNRVRIITVPIHSDDPHTVLLHDSDTLLEVPESDLVPHNSLPATSKPSEIPALPWVRHNERVTLYLPNVMATPKQVS